MRYALVDANDLVVNVIEYDGVQPYKPKDGLSLIEVNDWIEIGDNKDTEKKPPVVQDIIEAKQRRNEVFKRDLSLKASYKLEKKDNPALKFSDYLDQLESEEV